MCGLVVQKTSRNGVWDEHSHIVRDERFDGKSLDPGIEARLELQSMSRFASRMEAVDENTADLFPFTF